MRKNSSIKNQVCGGESRAGHCWGETVIPGEALFSICHALLSLQGPTVAYPFAQLALPGNQCCCDFICEGFVAERG